MYLLGRNRYLLGRNRYLCQSRHYQLPDESKDKKAQVSRLPTLTLRVHKHKLVPFFFREGGRWGEGFFGTLNIASEVYLAQVVAFW